jgi:hypothetical protein
VGLPGCIVEGGVNIGAAGAGGGSSDTFDLDGPSRGGTAGGGAKGTTGATTGPGAKKPSSTPATTKPATPVPTSDPTNMETDGWTEQNSGVTADLHGVAVRALSTGQHWIWAVGERGTIIRSIDSGVTWAQMSSRTTKALYAVAYAPIVKGASESHILVVGGEAGTLLMSYDSGGTWASMSAPVASKSTDPPGAIRNVDIWGTGTTDLTMKRTLVYVSTDRYPLMVSPNASPGAVPAWDVPGKFVSGNGSAADEDPVPVRDDSSWPLTATSADMMARFGFFKVARDRAYGLLLARDLTNLGFCGSATCIGYPHITPGNVIWKWRSGVKFDGGDQPDGEPTDLATVPENDAENSQCLTSDTSYVAFLTTTRAIYRTSDYGTTWTRVLGAGANRIAAAGRGKVTAISDDRVWHGETTYPQAPPPPKSPCPKGQPRMQWRQVIRSGEIALNSGDQYLAVLRSTGLGGYFGAPDAWLVGKGGRVLRRRAPAN